MRVYQKYALNQQSRYEEPNLEVKLSDELEGSLRQLKVSVSIKVVLTYKVV